jgi:hypothetical protein
MAVLLIQACSACGGAEKAPAQVHVQHADDVVFFERPAALAAARASGDWVPSLILIETQPWAHVIGSDSPTFALYEDGTVIWRRGDGFRTARLSDSEVVRLFGNLNANAVRRFHGGYRAAEATDQPEENLLVYRGGPPSFISIYGSLKSADVRAKVPAEVLQAYNKLKTFDLARGTEWLPERIEVMVWPYEYAPEPSIRWPRNLPDLNDVRTQKRGDSFSIYVASSALNEVRDVLSHRKAKGAVEINGQKWAASIRLPFPGETLWMAPNPELEPGDK